MGCSSSSRDSGYVEIDSGSFLRECGIAWVLVSTWAPHHPNSAPQALIVCQRNGATESWLSCRSLFFFPLTGVVGTVRREIVVLAQNGMLRIPACYCEGEKGLNVKEKAGGG